MKIRTWECGLDCNLVRLKEIINQLTHDCHMVKCTLGIATKIKFDSFFTCTNGPLYCRPKWDHLQWSNGYNFLQNLSKVLKDTVTKRKRDQITTRPLCCTLSDKVNMGNHISKKQHNNITGLNPNERFITGAK